ncbi:MAG TPA: ferrous iron transport protein B [Saprospiraceae bacterium]|nr:ferrous iron transport protein B [Saprospiraceae bacterium]
MPVIALIGNPNSGKSALFNALTGIRQKVANYPGVTVDLKSGKIRLQNNQEVTIVDMPGLYSVYAAGEDGKLVVRALLDKEHRHHPDAILYVVDATQIESQLLLLTQLSDLGFPVILVVNMIDAPGFIIDYQTLSKNLQIPVIPVSSRTLENVEKITHALPDVLSQSHPMRKAFYAIPESVNGSASLVNGHDTAYRHYLNAICKPERSDTQVNGNKNILAAQVEETLTRSDLIKRLLAGSVKSLSGKNFSRKIDRIVTHWLVGPLIFVAIMILVFQAIFAWALYPMEGIEWFFSKMGALIHQTFGEGWLTSFLADGLLAGLSGVLMFVPQIAILFFLVSILEETGYMARAVFLFDRLLQRFGMNGRSIVSLISGGACAIPAIMSTRTIENQRERLITILVTPFISCSARIPVFTVLIAFVVPYKRIGGIFNSQGLMFAGLYALGVIAALGSAWIFKQILKARDASFLVLELPKYRRPDWLNVWTEVKSKAGSFIREAGKIIIMISLILWFLASFGPGGAMRNAEHAARAKAAEESFDQHETDNLIASYRLEASFAGILGKVIEPAIKPLGYDWKIGIALITSFAAREVFVGSMATIYSVGSDTDEFRLREFLANVKDPDTGKKVFNFATALSLILFYLLALQCMSTLAVVRKETGTWKWPIVQFLFMGGLAYLVSWGVYQWMS